MDEGHSETISRSFHCVSLSRHAHIFISKPTSLTLCTYFLHVLCVGFITINSWLQMALLLLWLGEFDFCKIKSAEGLREIWYKQWQRSSNASPRFPDSLSHDKVYWRRLRAVCSFHSLLVQTWIPVCAAALISVLSLFYLFCSFTATPGFYSLHKKSKSKDTGKKKGITSTTVYLHVYLWKKRKEIHAGKATEITRTNRTFQKMRR